MRTIKLVVEYDGSAYCGFQRQPRQPSVQEAFEKALSQLLNAPTKIQGASSRTDSGVHAAGQVISFKTGSAMPAPQMKRGLNALLPRDVAVVEAREAAADFHARYGAKWKVYEYCIWNSPVRSPLLAARTYHVPQALDLKKMRAAARLLKGRHDFRSFCAADPAKKEKGSTVRTLRRFDVTAEGPLVRVRVEGNGFLYKMVRNLVGTLVDAGAGRMEVREISEILAAKDRKKAGKTVPPQGLTLLKVSY